jgi:hypothetical protein
MYEMKIAAFKKLVEAESNTESIYKDMPNRPLPNDNRSKIKRWKLEGPIVCKWKHLQILSKKEKNICNPLILFLS